MSISKTPVAMTTSQILRDAAVLVRDPKVAAAIGKWSETIDACSPQRQEAVIAALAQREVALRPLMPNLRARERILDRATPYALPSRHIDISARLVLGETPAQITGLTNAEAHAYFSDRKHGVGIEEPPSWLAIGKGVWPVAGKDWRLEVSIARCLRTVPLARWLIAVLNDLPRREALLRKRSERGPHGETIDGAFIERLDELRDADLRPSVDETFDRAARRMWKATERAMAKKQAPLTVAPRWWKPARCAKILLSGADLIAEGRDMHHCAATYAGYVARGNCIVISLRVPFYNYDRRTPHCTRLRGGLDNPSAYRTAVSTWQRSTVEIDRKTLTVHQHKGPSNCEPHPICVAALEVLLRRWRRSATSDPGAPVSWGLLVDPPYGDDDPYDECPF